MKKIIIFLILISFILCRLDPAKLEEIKQRRKEEMKLIAECLLKNENTDEELKKSIRENKDFDLVKALRPKGRRLNKSDLEIIKQCRREILKAKAENLKMEEPKKTDEINPHDL